MIWDVQSLCFKKCLSGEKFVSIYQGPDTRGNIAQWVSYMPIPPQKLLLPNVAQVESRSIQLATISACFHAWQSVGNFAATSCRIKRTNQIARYFFNWVPLNQNQSDHYFQHKGNRPSQFSKQIHVANTKRGKSAGKTCAKESRDVVIGLIQIGRISSRWPIHIIKIIKIIL